MPIRPEKLPDRELLLLTLKKLERLEEQMADTQQALADLAAAGQAQNEAVAANTAATNGLIAAYKTATDDEATATAIESAVTLTQQNTAAFQTNTAALTAAIPAPAPPPSSGS